MRTKLAPKATRLDSVEVRMFAAIKRYVRAMCGPVSDAEVLRFLVRNWEPK